MLKAFFTLLTAVSLVILSSSAAVRAQSVSAAALPGTQTAQRFNQQITHNAQLNYLLFLPEGYSASETKKWPLMLFLHGAGERGTNVDLVTVHGPPKLVKTKKDFPFVLISPQCPAERVWRDDELLALLDSVIATQN